MRWEKKISDLRRFYSGNIYVFFHQPKGLFYRKFIEILSKGLTAFWNADHEDVSFIFHLCRLCVVFKSNIFSILFEAVPILFFWNILTLMYQKGFSSKSQKNFLYSARWSPMNEVLLKLRLCCRIGWEVLNIIDMRRPTLK